MPIYSNSLTSLEPRLTGELPTIHTLVHYDRSCSLTLLLGQQPGYKCILYLVPLSLSLSFPVRRACHRPNRLHLESIPGGLRRFAAASASTSCQVVGVVDADASTTRRWPHRKLAAQDSSSLSSSLGIKSLSLSLSLSLKSLTTTLPTLPLT